jgi:hypothetical protein
MGENAQAGLGRWIRIRKDRGCLKDQNDSHHFDHQFDEEQDPDPDTHFKVKSLIRICIIRGKKLDPDPH